MPQGEGEEGGGGDKNEVVAVELKALAREYLGRASAVVFNHQLFKESCPFWSCSISHLAISTGDLMYFLLF